jgi:hypothetical protein
MDTDNGRPPGLHIIERFAPSQFNHEKYSPRKHNYEWDL